MSEITGSCRCGQYQYTLSRAPLFAAYCHCSDCQKRSSSPCTSLIMIDKDSMQTAGEHQQYAETGGSGKSLNIHRCSHCGTMLFMQVEALSNIVAIAAESLHDMAHFQPQGHMWTSSKQAWFEISDKLPQLPGPPKLPRSILKG